jgi:crotonobetainyl-CoA:carnitine CoA-transferase CaiB-like acyl-CoA transferase
VENPQGGEAGRFSLRGPSGQGQDSWYFLLFNANKKSITVNLKSERGLKLVRSAPMSWWRISRRAPLNGWGSATT